MKHDDLLDVTRVLLKAGRGKPKQAFLRRAASTTYYALFHALAKCCADCLIGGNGADRSDPAWEQVYRALDHGFARNQCRDGRISKFPQAIQDFANLFATMQVKRHQADYNPFEKLTKLAVELDMAQAHAAIKSFRAAPLRDRRAFAAYVLLKSRRD